MTTSVMAPLTYMNDEVADKTANRVVMPQGMQMSDGPMNPMYTQQMAGADRDLDTQPPQGPRNPELSLGETLNAYIWMMISDILHTSQMKTSFSLLSLNNVADDYSSSCCAQTEVQTY